MQGETAGSARALRSHEREEEEGSAGSARVPRSLAPEELGTAAAAAAAGWVRSLVPEEGRSAGWAPGRMEERR